MAHNPARKPARVRRPTSADAPGAGPDAPPATAVFAPLADRWWDPAGPLAGLHALNPARIGFVRDRLAERFGRDPGAPAPLEGLRVLDVGCGGGIACEPLARLGARVTGVDAEAGALEAARRHAAGQGLAIDYRLGTAEALVRSGERFEAVLALEIVEHVDDPRRFVRALANLVSPQGIVILATLNRTLRSLALAKWAAEYVFGLVPRGAHDWRQFLSPAEVAALARGAGLRLAQVRGLVLDPKTGDWRVGDDTAMNYLAVALPR